MPRPEEHEEADISKPVISRSRIYVWLRRLYRRFFSTPTPVPRCSALTRRGLPCRAPAMDNGVCRMHGGERRPTLRERLSFSSSGVNS